ncbi:MAG: N-formylglutamate amidohydrolase [Microthrixaceae bacterium]
MVRLLHVRAVRIPSRLGVTVVRTSLSRFVADPNRDPDSGHGGFWRTVVPAVDPQDRPLYARPLTDAEVADRVAAAHTPFHRLLDEAIGELSRSNRPVLVLDLHSFGLDLGVDVVLGTGAATPPRRRRPGWSRTRFRSHGYTTVRNRRFTGGRLVQRAGAPGRVDAVQIELNQRVPGPGAGRLADRRARPRPGPVGRGVGAPRTRLAGVVAGFGRPFS